MSYRLFLFTLCMCTLLTCLAVGPFLGHWTSTALLSVDGLIH